MKRVIAIILGLMTIIIIDVSALIHQHTIKNGRSIYIELAPVDPRSLIQGDYMVLDYELYTEQTDKLPSPSKANKVLLIVDLDQYGKVIKSVPYQKQSLTTNQHLLWVKYDQYSNLYPASKSFLFGEGLAYCYQQAYYAEFKVTRDGQPLLHKLANQALHILDCKPEQLDQNEQLPGFFR